MRLVPASLAIAPILLAVLVVPSEASAIGKDESSGTAKGTVGGGLLGAELVLVIEAAADVQSPWAYLGGGVLGAAGGAVGGYFIERDSSARVSMLLLAGGLTLAIPTTVAVLSATAYEPPADYIEDKPPADEPVADPPQPSAPSPTGTPAPAPTTSVPSKHRVHRVATLPPLRLAPPAIIDFSPEMLALRLPAVEIRDSYSPRELAMFGVEQATEVRVPVLSVAF